MLNEELDAISVPELRRRVDRAVAYIREMRSALAVQAGMTLEDAPGPIPGINAEEGRIALEQMMATLPLLRRRLTPEERAKLVPVSEKQNELGKEMLDQLLADDDAIEALAEGDVEGRHPPVSREKLVKLRESFDKTDMLREFEREIRSFLEEMQAFKQRLEERVAAGVAQVVGKRGPPS